MIQGNERVLRARLSDAEFFWASDQKVRLEDQVDKLESVLFHEAIQPQGREPPEIAVQPFRVVLFLDEGDDGDNHVPAHPADVADGEVEIVHMFENGVG